MHLPGSIQQIPLREYIYMMGQLTANPARNISTGAAYCKYLSGNTYIYLQGTYLLGQHTANTSQGIHTYI
jgi:hypothetical protein